MMTYLRPISFAALLLALMPLSGCGGGSNAGGDTTPRATCVYRPSDNLGGCVRLITLSPQTSAPSVQAGSLYVGEVLVEQARVQSVGSYYSVSSPEWDSTGEWIIYEVALKSSVLNSPVVRGYNPTTGAKWFATFNTSGGRTISNGRVYYNHTESAGTTRWSLKIDGTDHRKES